MKRLFFGTLGALLVVGVVAGCLSDPTADLRGDVVRVLLSRTYVEIDVGEVQRLNAKAFDAQGNVVGILPDIAISDASVVSFIVDDTTSGDPLPQTDFQISADAPGSVTVTATAGGVTSDPTTVISFPTEFDGTVTVDQSGLQDMITIAATSAITFDTGATVVTVNDLPVAVISMDASTIVAAVPYFSAMTGATVTLDNLIFLSDIAIASLDAITLVDTRGVPMTSAYTASPNWTAGPFPITVYVYIDGSDPDAHAMFMPAADLALTVDVDWDTDADVDIYWLNDTGAIVACGGGCSSAHPEQSVHTVGAGVTEYLDINLYSGAASVATVVIN